MVNTWRSRTHSTQTDARHPKRRVRCTRRRFPLPSPPKPQPPQLRVRCTHPLWAAERRALAAELCGPACL